MAVPLRSASGFEPGTDPTSDMLIVETPGTNGQRISLQAMAPTKSAQLELVPGSSCPTGQITSEILLFNVTGANAEKLELSWYKDQAFLVTGRYGSGSIRSLNIGVDSQSDLYIDTSHNVTIINPLSGVTLGIGGPKLISGGADPSLSPGVAAPLGSLYLRTNGEMFLKTGSSNTGWTLK